MSKTEQLVETLSQLSVLEMAELKKALEDKWGVKAAAAAVAVAAAPAAAAAAVEESTEFEVKLEGAPADKKIGVIKVVREITGLGLKEAKDLVDSSEGEAKVLKTGISKADADTMLKKLQEAGAKASKRGL